MAGRVRGADGRFLPRVEERQKRVCRKTAAVKRAGDRGAGRNSGCGPGLGAEKPVSRPTVQPAAGLENEAAARPAAHAESCLEYVRQQVAAGLPEICAGLMEKAREGDAAALKLLWQMAAFEKPVKDERGQRLERGARFAAATVAEIRGRVAMKAAASRPDREG